MLRNPLDPKIEEERLSFLKSYFSDKEYDIFLAHDISLEESRDKLNLYFAVSHLGERLGHNVFAPQEFVGIRDEKCAFEPRDCYVLLNDIMLPKSKLVLSYMGINSSDVGSICGKAMLLEKPILYFYEEGTHIETIGETSKQIISRSFPESLANEPRMLYHRNLNTGELLKYPHTVATVEFKNYDELLIQLEEKIKQFFS